MTLGQGGYPLPARWVLSKPPINGGEKFALKPGGSQKVGGGKAMWRGEKVLKGRPGLRTVGFFRAEKRGFFTTGGSESPPGRSAQEKTGCKILIYRRDRGHKKGGQPGDRLFKRGGEPTEGPQHTKGGGA